MDLANLLGVTADMLLGENLEHTRLVIEMEYQQIWYDALELEWGKSLRGQIDNGIKRSKFAILVLSKNFFAKKWPQRELDGILAKEEVTGATPLPIWYNISQAEVYEFSPTLAGLYSLSNDRYSIADICQSFKLILQKGNN